MPLVRNSYGKGRVRVMRVHRDGDRCEVRETTALVMLEGGFARAYTDADNRAVVATDTIKNVVNIVAHENLAAPAELYARAVAERFLDRYPQVERATVALDETKWNRLLVDGQPHPHGFVLDGNGKGTAKAILTREGAVIESGVAGFSFMKATGSGWVDYLQDDYTTLKETTDRICATAMDASWRWSSPPADYAAANAHLLRTMLTVFVTTYSAGVQDSLYRMGETALAAVPEVAAITMACPNKHYLPINLAPFGLENRNAVFTPTDEPHGQIECTVGRG